VEGADGVLKRNSSHTTVTLCALDSSMETELQIRTVNQWLCTADAHVPREVRYDGAVCAS
jgi:hypothetical protein